jgi:hypothetical protein
VYLAEELFHYVMDLFLVPCERNFLFKSFVTLITFVAISGAFMLSDQMFLQRGSIFIASITFITKKAQYIPKTIIYEENSSYFGQAGKILKLK